MIDLHGRAARFTPAGEHCFFGYYDIPAFSSDGKKHLYLKVRFMDRMQEKDDVAEIWVHDFARGADEKLAQTTAWNFQQACMLQWHPAHPDEIIYNVRADTPCGYGAAIQNLSTGRTRFLDRPVANVARTGTHAVSVNFDRMFDFRPGYGYAGRRDPFFDVNHPGEDGIFITDLATGKSRLTVSLDRIWDFCGAHFGSDEKIMINHITFNPSGERLVFLVRNFGAPGGMWETAILTCDRAGRELFLLSDFAMASHYFWKNDRVLDFYSDGREVSDLGAQFYELTDLAHAGRALDPDFFVRDGHMSDSPDGNWLLYDSYIFPDFTRQLYLYNPRAKKGGLLGVYHVPEVCVGDIRSDLHPVWAPDSRTISFDSVHEGFRGVYRMDLAACMELIK